MVEELTVLKTLTAIVEWIMRRAGAPAAGDCAPAAVALQAPLRAGRFVQRAEPAGSPAGSDTALAGRRFFISDDGGGIARALAALLERRGAHASVGDVREGWSADDLVHLASLSPNPPALGDLFGELVPHLDGDLRSLLLVTGSGGSFGRDGAAAAMAGPLPLGAGLRGMARSLAREHRDLRVRTVDIDPASPPAVAAGQLLTEVLSADPLLEVGYRSERRLRLRTVPEPLVQDGSVGVRLGRGDVVLITGGGRGITAAVAVALAREGCHLELVGRTPLSTPAEDAGKTVPTEAERQILATLDAVAAAGGSADYHSLDVRDAPAMAELVDGVYRRRGRLDGVIHGAGVIEDQLAVDKTVESFSRVFDTKVQGARGLLSAVRPGTRFVVLFGSVAGAFGNRGQVDYAATNEALEAMAWAHNGGPAGRVVCVHWGPWGGTGMVSPGLEREFARRGVGLIDPEEGAACLLRELSLGSPSAACVVVMRADPDTLGAPAAAPLRDTASALEPSR